jgi:hypothetical protein
MSALCPICFGTFETDEIERHASTCNGTEDVSLSLAERATETSDKDEEVVNCPICFQKFDACEELQRHASECNGAGVCWHVHVRLSLNVWQPDHGLASGTQLARTYHA